MARSHRQAFGERLDTYRCVFCGQLHLGHDIDPDSDVERARAMRELWRLRIEQFADETIPAMWLPKVVE